MMVIFIFQLTIIQSLILQNYQFFHFSQFVYWLHPNAFNLVTVKLWSKVQCLLEGSTYQRKYIILFDQNIFFKRNTQDKFPISLVCDLIFSDMCFQGLTGQQIMKNHSQLYCTREHYEQYLLHFMISRVIC